ncbi:STAS domain-containing protein [Streptomyces sp. NPDC006284]|uniref:STAS domain-containing protein n=1 Tax=Streptomyces sp. NPDC006284 TaxID=3156742 RepID=UPI00339E8657
MSAVPLLPRPCEPCDPPGYAVLDLPPEIDYCNAEGLLPMIMAAVDHHSGALHTLVLDLTATRFMDSQGVRLLSEVRARLHGRAELRVVAAREGVPSRVLELSGLRRDVPVHDNLAEALHPHSGAARGPDGRAGGGAAA